MGWRRGAVLWLLALGACVPRAPAGDALPPAASRLLDGERCRYGAADDQGFEGRFRTPEPVATVFVTIGEALTSLGYHLRQYDVQALWIVTLDRFDVETPVLRDLTRRDPMPGLRVVATFEPTGDSVAVTIRTHALCRTHAGDDGTGSGIEGGAGVEILAAANTMLEPHGPYQAAGQFVGALPPEAAGFRLADSSSWDEWALGTAYHYRDTRARAIDVYLYPVLPVPSGSIATSTAELAASRLHEFLAGLPEGVKRGWYREFAVASSGPCQVGAWVGTCAEVRYRYDDQPDRRSRFALFVEGRRYVKFRATLPEGRLSPDEAQTFERAVLEALAGR